MKKTTMVITLLAAVLAGTLGCRSAKTEKQKDDFFTSGSREADQRASQRMARDQQLAGPEKNVKNAKPDAAGAPAQAEDKLTLFDRLGGETGITAIIDDFTTRALEDPRVNWQRQGVKRGSFLRREQSTAAWNATPESIGTLKKHLVQFLSLATGGPAEYDGKQMTVAHAGMRISNPEFDAAIGDLKATLDKHRIPNKEQKELLAIIESTRPQIVTER